ncbi:glycoside hydrolase family 3 N-terminal domain-containing protein [Vibrio breoganii]|uniref:glycoside hydrolase family 3 N-terminal domain-containing protein n=1 Tax=Vibrio breoganii TaxID=553239 RepID=UPI000C829DE8|nr:glycoside hydrolase family 3 N-terminal domain-containing protein [Vibrio breoganii]PMG95074.1 beta-glucosidase [Vibrio breoganii]PMJ45056.1 beta-glucosidase [Vibrio breoganii]PMK56228.1 beta-glucosidase [Vibrio breoganii]PMM79112.1 beta-glucosidase [Vibrio breoganii]PMO26381.1 beta-glucosidase [Vibrio breoganii]
MNAYLDAKLPVKERVHDLLGRMTLAEKIGQLCQCPMHDYENNKQHYLAKVKQGQWGSKILAETAWAGNNPVDTVEPAQLNEIQKAAVEGSRLGIPIIFARDVIYGQATVLPIPLAQAASWNPELVQEAYRSISKEAASLGINWTFAPMLDIVRDPRWGRVIESSGEDPYLGSQFAKSVVKGFQGDSLSDPDSILACAKHFVGYGAAEGGRDYDTTEITDNTLHNVYLPAFASAVEAGVATLMTAFNDLGGTPTSSASKLINGWLREGNGFDGMIVSDWGSIADLEYFGVTKDGAGAAKKALLAGIDMAMTNEAYEDHLAQLVENDPKLMEAIDLATSRVLEAKFKVGLFENPYVDPDRHKTILRHPDHVAQALDLAEQSIVMLKNDNQVLPLRDKAYKVAVIGPHAHSKRQHLGSWCLDGKTGDVTSIAEGISNLVKNVEVLTEHATFSDEMVECANSADVVVLCVGESQRRNGEARNIAELTLPPGQEELIEAIGETGKPLIVVQCTGRPIPSPMTERYADALLQAWQSGTETGTAVARLLFGEVSPSGKLPMTVPRSTGQIPMYYARKPIGKMRGFPEYSPYKDSLETPLYPFGFGLSYSQFEFGDVTLSYAMVAPNEDQQVLVTVTNLGSVVARETVQCYIRRKVASTTRPVKELKAFKKVTLKPAESIQVALTLTPESLAYYGAEECFTNDAGEIDVFIGNDSNAPLSATFTIQG